MVELLERKSGKLCFSVISLYGVGMHSSECFPLPCGWDADVMVGAGAATLNSEIEAKFGVGRDTLQPTSTQLWTVCVGELNFCLQAIIFYSLCKSSLACS